MHLKKNFQETETAKKFYIFSKESSSYVSENRNPGKILYILEKRTFLIFQETEAL